MTNPLTVKVDPLANALRGQPEWNRRHIASWRDYKGGVAFVKMYMGYPRRVKVLAHGFLDEYPYHIALCQIVCMDRRAKLSHGRVKNTVWWKLRVGPKMVAAGREREPHGIHLKLANLRRRS